MIEFDRRCVETLSWVEGWVTLMAPDWVFGVFVGSVCGLVGVLLGSDSGGLSKSSSVDCTLRAAIAAMLAAEDVDSWSTLEVGAKNGYLRPSPSTTAHAL